MNHVYVDSGHTGTHHLSVTSSAQCKHIASASMPRPPSQHERGSGGGASSHSAAGHGGGGESFHGSGGASSHTACGQCGGSYHSIPSTDGRSVPIPWPPLRFSDPHNTPTPLDLPGHLFWGPKAGRLWLTCAEWALHEPFLEAIGCKILWSALDRRCKFRRDIDSRVARLRQTKPEIEEVVWAPHVHLKAHEAFTSRFSSTFGPC